MQLWAKEANLKAPKRGRLNDEGSLLHLEAGASYTARLPPSGGAGIDGTLSGALTTKMNLTTLTAVIILTNLEILNILTVLKIMVDLAVVIADNVVIGFCTI